MWPPRPTTVPGTTGLPSYDRDERLGDHVMRRVGRQIRRREIDDEGTGGRVAEDAGRRGRPGGGARDRTLARRGEQDETQEQAAGHGARRILCTGGSVRQ